MAVSAGGLTKEKENRNRNNLRKKQERKRKESDPQEKIISLAPNHGAVARSKHITM